MSTRSINEIENSWRRKTIPVKPVQLLGTLLLVGAPLFTAENALAGGSKASTPTPICQELLKIPDAGEITHLSKVTLKPKGDHNAAYRAVLVLIAGWFQKSFNEIQSAPPIEEFEQAFEQKYGNTLVASRASEIPGESGAMDGIWAAALERDSGSSGQRNRLEVTVRKRADGGKIDVLVTVTSWSSSESPLSKTNPSLVHRLIESSSHWTVADKPHLRPIQPTDHETTDFIKVLTKKKRRPVLYLSQKRTGGFYISPQVLADHFGSIADIYHDSSVETRPMIYRRLPESYAVWDGAVSVFEPEVNLDDRLDSRRHTFIHPGVHSQQEVLDKLRQVLIQTVLRNMEGQPRGLLAVMQADARWAGNQLAAQRNSQGDPEYQALLEEELTHIQGELSAARANNTALMTNLQEANERLELLEAEIKRLQFRGSTARNVPAPVSQPSHFPMTLARSPLEALEYFRDHFPDRIYVTERALRSAKNTKFQNARIAWEILAGTVFKLHDLYFSQAVPMSSQKIANEFLSATGYEYSVSESYNTHVNPHFSALRQLDYKGQTVSIDPHIKYGGRAPDLLRVHIYIDRVNRVIVIGHFGDHLENGATRHQ